MKVNKDMFFYILILLFVSGYFFLSPGAAKSQEFGTVLIAHGSNNPEWNTRIKEFYNNIKPDLPPSQLAFLRFVEGNTLQEAVTKLINDNPGIREILFVHLSPSSYSIRHEEIASIASPLIQPPLQYKIAPAMDDHHLSVEILEDYAKALSRSPGNESLILLGYGPIEELENIVWVRQLERMGERIRRDLGFREVSCMTLRHHSADLIRSQAITDLQRTATRLKEGGRVIVVPHIFCSLPEDGFQREVQSCLRGIVDLQDICTMGIISHPMTKEWVKEVVRKGMKQPGIKIVNRTWSAMDAEMRGDFKYKYGRVKIERVPKVRREKSY
jgi:sirohydrochlorin ferrochelatase